MLRAGTEGEAMLTGGCLCGAVRYETDGVPYHETICHCGHCRRALGAAFGAYFSVPRASVRWIGEEPRRYRSSDKAERGFCPHCGTGLTYEPTAKPEEMDLTIPSLDDPDTLLPHDEIYAAYRLRWARLASGLPEYREARKP